MTATRWGRGCLAALLVAWAAACSAGEAPAAGPAPSAPDDGASWSVDVLDPAALGDGWSSRDLPDPAAGVIDGLCGVPEVMEHFPPREVVRFERDAVVTHAIVETDDAPGLAALLVNELELCEQEDGRVTDASRVILDADVPPTDSFRIQADVALLGIRTDGVWAITAVDDTVLSVVGASISDLFEDPGDPLALVEASMEDVYRENPQR